LRDLLVMQTRVVDFYLQTPALSPLLVAASFK